MTPARAKELLPIIQAFAEGKTIQQYSSISPERGWVDYKEYHDWNIWVADDKVYKWRIKPEKKKGWVNIYPYSQQPNKYAGDVVGIYNTKELADAGAVLNRVACIEIEYEEGEGL